MDMKKVTAGALAATVLTLGGGAALAAGQNPATAQNGGAAATQEQAQEEQEPSYTGSIKAPGGQDSENEAAEGPEGKETTQSEAAEDKAEAAEEQQLQSLAKIDQRAAEQAALQAVPGQVAESELGNENGFVVYEVEIKGDDGQTHEVKVDAGNGNVLAQEIDDDYGESAESESGESESGEQPEAGEAQEAPATTGGK